MTDWVYNGKPITPEEIPEKAIGFVYRITRRSDGKFYIGKKLLVFSSTSTKSVKKKDGSVSKKKVRTLRESDWKTYWGSSKELQEDVQSLGEQSFDRVIIAFCQNKGSLGYYEAREQMDARVLEIGDNSYNGQISCRIHHSHVKPLLS